MIVTDVCHYAQRIIDGHPDHRWWAKQAHKLAHVCLPTYHDTYTPDQQAFIMLLDHWADAMENGDTITGDRIFHNIYVWTWHKHIVHDNGYGQRHGAPKFMPPYDHLAGTLGYG